MCKIKSEQPKNKTKENKKGGTNKPKEKQHVKSDSPAGKARYKRFYVMA